MESSAGSDCLGRWIPENASNWGEMGPEYGECDGIGRHPGHCGCFPCQPTCLDWHPHPVPGASSPPGMSCAPQLATGKGRVDPGATLATTVLLRGPLSILTFCRRQLPLGIVRLRPTTPLCHLAALGLWGITGQFVFLLTIPRGRGDDPACRKKLRTPPGRRKPSGCSLEVCRKIRKCW